MDGRWWVARRMSLLACEECACGIGENVRGSDCDPDSGCVSKNGEGERRVGDEFVEICRAAT